MISSGVSAEYWHVVNCLDNVNYCKVHKKCQKQRKTVILINITRRALGREHVPPTKVFPQLTVNKTIFKPRLAAVTGAQYLYMGFSRRNKILRCSTHDIGESNPVPGSGL